MSTEIPVPVFLVRSDLKGMGIKVSNSTLLRWEALGRFPRRVVMAGTSVCWLASEIDTWIASCAAARASRHYADPFG